jgi:CNT family concentrative nucleoside transporter
MVQGFFGIFIILLLCRVLCEDPRHVSYFPILKALLIQIILAALIIWFDPVRHCIHKLGNGLEALRQATLSGTSFVFGYLGGNIPPFEIKQQGSFFIFAFQALPLVIVVSALAMLLFHWNILPRVVRLFSFFFRYTLSIGGALGTCSAAKLFLSQTETPLIIKPYISRLSRGELFSIMVLGMATTAGSVLVIYALLLHKIVPDALTHLISASLINIPGAIAVSRLMVPHGASPTEGDAIQPYAFQNSLDAIYEGTSQGLKLFLNIIATLIVFIALIHLTNSLLGLVPTGSVGSLKLQTLVGYLLKPLVWIMGVPWHETTTAGSLLGVKTIINEMVAFEEFSKISSSALSKNARVIMTYALCGFANLSSIGLQIATLGTIANERRKEVISLGFRALIAGTFASCLSGTIVGILITLS